MNVSDFYNRFSAPICIIDCGEHCAPYNDRGTPFCCDTHHAVPTAYDAEWVYLQTCTNLWHKFELDNPKIMSSLRGQLPEGQELLECLGHRDCQRDYRTIACRSFPFYPYITRHGEFIGLSYYWKYEDRCWVISNLSKVSQDYRQQFISVFDDLLLTFPDELENYRYHSSQMRRVFGRWRRTIPLLHRNGKNYKVTPSNGRMRRIPSQSFPMHGVYKIAAALPFPGESA